MDASVDKAIRDSIDRSCSFVSQIILIGSLVSGLHDDIIMSYRPTKCTHGHLHHSNCTGRNMYV